MLSADGAGALPALPHADLAVVQVGREPRCGAEVGAVAIVVVARDAVGEEVREAVPCRHFAGLPRSAQACRPIGPAGFQLPSRQRVGDRPARRRRQCRRRREKGACFAVRKGRPGKRRVNLERRALPGSQAFRLEQQSAPVALQGDAHGVEIDLELCLERTRPRLIGARTINGGGSGVAGKSREDVARGPAPRGSVASRSPRGCAPERRGCHRATSGSRRPHANRRASHHRGR